MECIVLTSARKSQIAARIAGPAIVLCALPGLASAQDATWLFAPITPDFNTSANWNPATVPTATAIFNDSNTKTLTFSQLTSVGTLQFNAPNYFLDVGAAGSTGDDLIIDGAGIVASPANRPTFQVIGTPSHSTPSMVFMGNSSAGTAKIIAGNTVTQNNGFDGGFIKFFGNSTAGQATILTKDASNTEFHDASTAGTATLSVGPGGFLFFNETSNADHATITVINGGQLVFSLNDGGEFLGGTSTAGNATITSSGLIEFHDGSSAGSATINTHFGATNFFDTSTAGSAAFTVIEGNMDFFNNSRAGTATIIAGRPVSENGGFDAGFIKFHDNSSADQATISSLDGSSVEFHDSSRADHATLIVGRSGFLEFVDRATAIKRVSSTTLAAKSK